MVVWKLHDFKPEKSPYMCLGKDSLGDLLRFCEDDLEVGELETVLGIQIDNKLNFGNHFKSLFRKAFRNLGVLQIISNLLDTQKKNLFSKISVFSSYVLRSQKKL